MKRQLLLLLLLVLHTPILFAEVNASRIYDSDGDRIFENLKERMNQAGKSDVIPVIILYKEKTPLAGTYAVRLPRVDAGRIRFTYRNLPAVAAGLTKAQIEEVRKDPWVEHMELDAAMKAAMDTARSSFGVDAVRQQFLYTGNADGVKDSFTRDDIVVAVADTGVNASHPDLRKKVLFWKDYVNGRSAPYDDNGHGTLVAGVAVGAGKQKNKFAGVAPQAALVAFKVLDRSGNGSISSGIEAVDEALNRKDEFHIRVFNFSLAVSGSSNGKDAFSQACNIAVNRGIVMVVAAGNDGPNSRTIGSPSAAANVITAGAGADLGERGFSLADFSGRGPTADGRIKPDIFGPGVRITGPNFRGGYTTASGTSFASPFIAGVVALMLEANPLLTPAKVKSILMATAVRWGPGGKINEAGAGRLQAYEAITRATAITIDLIPPEVPELDFVRSSILQGEVRTVSFQVLSTAFPVAVTAVSLNQISAGLILDLIGPSGNVILSREAVGRQATLNYLPTSTGNYSVQLRSVQSGCTFLLDISADMFP